MSVYVGTMRWPFGRMVMFHMATDGQPEELHKLVDAIGVQRKWYQNKGSNVLTPHYDICLSKKRLAIQKGAIEINDRELIKRCFRKFGS